MRCGRGQGSEMLVEQREPHDSPRKQFLLLFPTSSTHLIRKKTSEQVMSKMRYIEKKFEEAEDFLRNTG